MKEISRKALVLFSGGLDSTTCLYLAKSENVKVIALSFDYSQRHIVELKSAKKIAKLLGVSHIVLKIDRKIFLGSSLTEKKIQVPKSQKISKKIIPNTYVPARNILFLSYAVSIAESYGLGRIYIGVNALDYSGYPDCREEFIEAFQKAINLGTKAGVEGRGIQMVAPLQNLKKKEISLLAKKLGVPISLTHSCYDPQKGKPCRKCDSCKLRARGLVEAGLDDT